LILEEILKQGVRLAQPGEFTKRAFLNGRIDLSQAEAVMDIIESRTDAALRSANDQSRGSLSRRIIDLRERLMNVMAKIEVTLDFPDDDLDRSSDLGLADDLELVKHSITELLKTSEKGKLLREGLKVVIAGKPNVGKSSLLNALLDEQRAIVTEIPGTTRDVIEEFINIEGIPVRLTDTAGIRETKDLVESMGVEKSRQSIIDADLIILVLDLSRELSDEDHELLDITKDRRRIVLLNKEDLPKIADIPESILEGASVISALNHFGTDRLKERIHEMTLGDSVGFDETLVTASRHKEALHNAESSLEEAVTAIHQGIPMDLVTIDVHAAWSALGEITGDTLQDDLVDKIFSGFCIGK
jgi:tRNA modification GTPase